MNNPHPHPVQPKQPMSATKHFWLSFLAVVTGVPVTLMVLFGGSILLSFLFFAIMIASVSSTPVQPNTLAYTMAYGDASAANTIVSVPVRGVILSGTAADPLQTLFGQSYADGELIKQQLRTLAENPTVSGVVLEIDSPGGMITASKAIADGIESYREMSNNKPIVAHINGTGASGGYWAASATDAIYAEQGSEAGSIGVIMGPLVTLKGVVAYGDVATTEPIQFRYFTAGRSKDLGSPFRDITAEEEAYLNAQLQAEYEKFVTHVSTNRNIEPATITGEIGALAYGTNDALRLKLIDGEMSREEVFDEVATRAGVSSDYNVMQVDSSVDFFGSFFGVKRLVRGMFMSESDKSAGRVRFCETNLASRPLILDGDPSTICK